MSVKIEYGDYAVGAKEAFVPTASEELEGVSQIEQIKQSKKYDPSYGNPVELYSVLLNGDASPLKDSIGENDVVGFWSEQISGNTGAFDTPIVLTVESNGENYFSNALAITFDVVSGVYPTRVQVAWYLDGETVSIEEYYPDSTRYVFRNPQTYDKVEFTFYSVNMPYNRLKIRNIEYGEFVIFEGGDLRQCKVSSKINPLSTEIPIGTGDFELIGDAEESYTFQRRQPLTITFNGAVQATVFVKTANRKNRNTYVIKAEDYIGVLDSVNFYGGMYQSKNAVELIESILNFAKVPFEIDPKLNSEEVTGHIPSCSCRDALMQVCFAIGAAVSTANSSIVSVFKVSALETTAMMFRVGRASTQRIQEERVLQGQTIEENTKVTRVSVTYHAYRAIDEVYTAYKTEDSGEGSGIVVFFNEPLHDLYYAGTGSIIERGANYAVINAGANFVLYGKKYEHNTSVKSQNAELILASDVENEISIDDATLVSASNVDNVLERCYNYYASVRKVKSKIVDGSNDIHVLVGDVVKIPTEYSGDVDGIVESVSFSLSGARIAKDTVIKELNV